MADVVSTQILLDGKTEATMAFNNASDGTGESAVQKVIVAQLQGQPDYVTVESLWFATQGMAVLFLWEATVNLQFWAAPQDLSEDKEFDEYFGGLRPVITRAGFTGNILFTTVGASAGDSYNLVLQLKKHWKAP